MLFSQGSNWIIAKNTTGVSDTHFGLSSLFFTSNSVIIEQKPIEDIAKIAMEETNTSISDKSGNLLFYTNGLTIFHAQHDTLKGSKNFNKGLWFYDGHDYKLPFRQVVMILPHPTNDNLYYIFHKNPTIYEGNIFQAHFLQYSVVDMQQDSGRGAVVIKNVIL